MAEYVYDTSQTKILRIFSNAKTGENEPEHSKMIQKDKNKLIDTFGCGCRGYKVVNELINSYNEIKDSLEQMSKQDHEETSLIIIGILMYISSDENSESTKYLYNMKYLQKLFEQCHQTLLNKPKVFLVQLYKRKNDTTERETRRKDAERRQMFEDYLGRERQENEQEVTAEEQDVTNKVIPSHSDIFLAKWTFEYDPDNVNNEGSPWINYICGILNQHPRPQDVDILDLIVMVNNEMIRENVEMPSTQSALTKIFLYI